MAVSVQSKLREDMAGTHFPLLSWWPAQGVGHVVLGSPSPPSACTKGWCFWQNFGNDIHPTWQQGRELWTINSSGNRLHFQQACWFHTGLQWTKGLYAHGLLPVEQSLWIPGKSMWRWSSSSATCEDPWQQASSLLFRKWYVRLE